MDTKNGNGNNGDKDRKTLKVWVKTWDMLDVIRDYTDETKVLIVHRLIKAELQRILKQNIQE